MFSFSRVLLLRLSSLFFFHRDEQGRMALHIASSCGHIESVKWLLGRKGMNKKQLNIVDNESRWSSLHRSAYYGYPDVMIALLKVFAIRGGLT